MHIIFLSFGFGYLHAHNTHTLALTSSCHIFLVSLQFHFSSNTFLFTTTLTLLLQRKCNKAACFGCYTLDLALVANYTCDGWRVETFRSLAYLSSVEHIATSNSMSERRRPSRGRGHSRDNNGNSDPRKCHHQFTLVNINRVTGIELHTCGGCAMTSSRPRHLSPLLQVPAFSCSSSSNNNNDDSNSKNNDDSNSNYGGKIFQQDYCYADTDDANEEEEEETEEEKVERKKLKSQLMNEHQQLTEEYYRDFPRRFNKCKLTPQEGVEL